MERDIKTAILTLNASKLDINKHGVVSVLCQIVPVCIALE